MENDELYQEALDAIGNLFNDKSVDQQQCIENFENLQNEMDAMIDSLNID